MTPWNYCCQGKDWGIEGQEQSPIDIPINTVIYSHSHSLDIQWINQKVPLRVLNNGFNVIFNGNISKMDGVTEIGNKLTFECIQFHFHSPGEHLLDGKQYPLELHIVHQIVKEKEEEIVKRNLAVIGIFFEVDDNATPHPFLESLSLDNLQENIEFNPYEFFSQIVKPEFYNYSGGLTTPPCAESVNWFVLSKPLKMTTDQLVRFSNLNESLPYVVGSIGNYRECQPLNGRQIYCGNCEKKIEVLKEPEEQSLFSKMD
jgi:carbonic anhydrase